MVQAFKNELRPTLSLALPMICTQLLNYGQQIIDTVMAGRHTPLTLAGVSLANQLFAIVYLFIYDWHRRWFFGAHFTPARK